MRKADILVSLLLMSIGIIVLVDSARLGFRWGMNGPESGFFPFYLGAGTVICSLLVLRKVAKQYKKEGAGGRLSPPNPSMAPESMSETLLRSRGLVVT